MANNKIQISDENIQWKLTGQLKNRLTSAQQAMASYVDNALMNMDLWIKDMNVEEMRHFVCQTMMTLADTFERATSDKAHAEAIRGFTTELAKRVGVLD